METFYDGLIFDDRTTAQLFDKKHSKQPFYADVLKRWVIGEPVNGDEQRILVNVLIYYPGYVLENGKTDEFGQIVDNLLRDAEINQASDVEKGLWLYTFLYFLVLTGAKEKWLPVLRELKAILSDHDNLDFTIVDVLHVYNLTERRYATTLNSNSPKQKIAKAWCEIISRILDLKEMLVFPQYFDLAKFPLPDLKMDGSELRDLRYSAFRMYQDQSYRQALNIYNILRIARFEPAGSLMHMARVQLALGNIEQAEIYTVMAWRNKETAEEYVVGRTLFAVIFLNMLQSKPFTTWLGCLKYLLTQPDNHSFLMEWDMRQVMDQYQPRLKINYSSLLKKILAVNSHSDIAKTLDTLALWKNTLPIAKEDWPEYEITGNVG